MSLGTLGASSLGNILAGKGINRDGEGPVSKSQGQGIVRVGYRNKIFLKTTTKNKKKF